MKPAASYARLSLTDNKSEPTLEFQHRRNVEFLESLGYRVPKENLLEEPKGHRSGRHIQQRPTMQELMVRLDNYSAIAFLDFSRFARSQSFTFDFIERANKCKTRLFNTSTQREITIKNASEFIEVGIQALMSEYESVAGSDRMRNAYNRARENGWIYHRRGPLGLRVEGSKSERHFVPNEDLKTVLEFLKLAARGLSVQECAHTLRANGYQARDSHNKLIALDAYHLYGIVQQLELYQPFVSNSLFQQASARLSERSNRANNGPKLKHPGGILQKLLECSECHHKYYLSNYGIPSYRHSGHYECVRKNARAHRTEIDRLVIAELKRFLEQIQIARDSLPTHEAPIKDTRKQDIERRLHNLRVVLISGNLTAEDIEDFNTQKQALEQELVTFTQKPKREVRLSQEQKQVALALAIQSEDELRILAEKKPESFNRVLRDIYERIIIHPDSRLEYKLRQDWLES